MTTPLRVLLVEDAEDEAFLWVGALHNGGYAVVSERVDTPAALAVALGRATWDLVLCDAALARFCGTAALELVHGQRPEVPVVVISGEAGPGEVDAESIVRAMKAGAQDYLGKDRLQRLVPAVQ